MPSIHRGSLRARLESHRRQQWLLGSTAPSASTQAEELSRATPLVRLSRPIGQGSRNCQAIVISDPRAQPKSWAYRVQRCYLNLQSGDAADYGHSVRTQHQGPDSSVRSTKRRVRPLGSEPKGLTQHRIVRVYLLQSHRRSKDNEQCITS